MMRINVHVRDNTILMVYLYLFVFIICGVVFTGHGHFVCKRTSVMQRSAEDNRCITTVRHNKGIKLI